MVLLCRLPAVDLARDPQLRHRVQVRQAGAVDVRLSRYARFFETAVLDTAVTAGLITVTLQIAHLPAPYAAFNRRENEIALLNSRAGTPSWIRIAGQDSLCPRLWHLGTGHLARVLQPVGTAADPPVPAVLGRVWMQVPERVGQAVLGVEGTVEAHSVRSPGKPWLPPVPALALHQCTEPRE